MFVPRYCRLITVTLMAILVVCGAAEGAQKYTIKDIGAIGPGVTVEGINSTGQIVGAVPAGLAAKTFRAWLYSGDTVIELGNCGGIGCRAMAINDKGQFVGNIGPDAYIYTHRKFIDLAAYARPQSIALAVNNSSEVVGWYTYVPVPGENFPAERHAFLYQGRKLTDLGTLGGIESVATSINNSGQIVGYSTAYGGESHAFVYDTDKGKIVDLGTLGGLISRANSINDAGHIVGSASVSGSNKQHAFLYADGKMVDLGTLEGDESQAFSINNSDQVVGISGNRGFLYSERKLVDLLTLVPPDSSWKTLLPRCINDNGQIAGVGNFSDGKPHVFLMTPVS
jgi:chitinase